MAAFSVRGSINGALYEVQVTGDAEAPVVGSRRVARLLKQQHGRWVLATPVGPAYLVDPADPASILALLVAQTRVRWVSDGAPALVEPLLEDAVR